MKNATILAAKIAITLGLLAIFARNADVGAMARSAAGIGWLTITAGFAVLFALSVVQALRWGAILTALGARLAYARTWIIVLIGFFFSQLLPASIGGDAARVWKATAAGTPLATAVNSVVLDRVTALVAAVLIVAAGAALLLRLFPGPAIGYVVAGGFALTTGAFIALALAVRIPAIPGFLSRPGAGRLSRLLGGAFKDAAAVLLVPRTLLATVSLSVFTHVAVSTVIWMIARDAGARVDWLTCAVLMPLVILVSMLPVSIAGWGVREGAMVVALGAAGVDHAIALTTSIVFGLVLAATGLPGGLIWLREHRHA